MCILISEFHHTRLSFFCTTLFSFVLSDLSSFWQNAVWLVLVRIIVPNTFLLFFLLFFLRVSSFLYFLLILSRDSFSLSFLPPPDYCCCCGYWLSISCSNSRGVLKWELPWLHPVIRSDGNYYHNYDNNCDCYCDCDCNCNCNWM